MVQALSKYKLGVGRLDLPVTTWASQLWLIPFYILSTSPTDWEGDSPSENYGDCLVSVCESIYIKCSTSSINLDVVTYFLDGDFLWNPNPPPQTSLFQKCMLAIGSQCLIKCSYLANLHKDQLEIRKMLFPYENIGFHPLLHPAAIWCHVCFWETAVSQYTWVKNWAKHFQVLESEISFVSEPTFQTVLEDLVYTCIWSIIMICHQPQIWGCQMPLTHKYCVFGVRIWHQRQYTLRYVSQIVNIIVARDSQFSKKKRPASTGTSRRDVMKQVSWGTFFGLCHALKGCFFASAIFAKKLDKRVGHQRGPMKILSIKINWSIANWNAIFLTEKNIPSLPLKLNPFLSQIIWSAPTWWNVSAEITETPMKRSCWNCPYQPCWQQCWEIHVAPIPCEGL